MTTLSKEVFIHLLGCRIIIITAIISYLIKCIYYYYRMEAAQTRLDNSWIQIHRVPSPFPPVVIDHLPPDGRSLHQRFVRSLAFFSCNQTEYCWLPFEKRIRYFFRWIYNLFFSEFWRHPPPYSNIKEVYSDLRENTFFFSQLTQGELTTKKKRGEFGANPSGLKKILPVSGKSLCPDTDGTAGPSILNCASGLHHTWKIKICIIIVTENHLKMI